MQGHANHRVLVAMGARRVGEAKSAQGRTLVDLGPYPALLPLDESRDRDAAAVAGEVYELEDARLAELDEFEGCPDLYRRERIALAGDAGDAWTYVLAGPPGADAKVIATGRYGGGGVVLHESAREAAARRAKG